MSGKVRLASAVFVATVALLYTAACGGGSSPASPTPPIGGGGSASVIVGITGINGNQSFSPNPASVASGNTIQWRNNDPANIHHIVADDGSFDAGNMAPGAASAVITVGSNAIQYHCANHPTMVGSINGATASGPTGPGY